MKLGQSQDQAPALLDSGGWAGDGRNPSGTGLHKKWKTGAGGSRVQQVPLPPAVVCSRSLYRALSCTCLAPWRQRQAEAASTLGLAGTLWSSAHSGSWRQEMNDGWVKLRPPCWVG